jgi:hypothetical protein
MTSFPAVRGVVASKHTGRERDVILTTDVERTRRKVQALESRLTDLKSEISKKESMRVGRFDKSRQFDKNSLERDIQAVLEMEMRHTEDPLHANRRAIAKKYEYTADVRENARQNHGAKTMKVSQRTTKHNLEQRLRQKLQLLNQGGGGSKCSPSLENISFDVRVLTKEQQPGGGLPPLQSASEATKKKKKAKCANSIKVE